MYAQGDSLAVIGTRQGVDAGTVHARLRERGMQMRDTHGRPVVTLLGEISKRDVPIGNASTPVGVRTYVRLGVPAADATQSLTSAR